MCHVVKIINVATQFRRAIKKSREDLPECMRRFPHGACLDTSTLLAAYLEDNGCGEFELLAVRWPNNDLGTHAWLEKGGWIVDITADQFNDVEKAVLVTQDHSWHNRFDALKLGRADFRRRKVLGAEWLQGAYAAILSHIE